jgi:hypothetical protein
VGSATLAFFLAAHGRAKSTSPKLADSRHLPRPRRPHKPNIGAQPQQAFDLLTFSHTPNNQLSSSTRKLLRSQIKTAIMARQFFVGGNFKMYVTTQAVSTA